MKLIDAIKIKIEKKDAVEIVIKVIPEGEAGLPVYYDIINIEGIHRGLELDAFDYSYDVGGKKGHIRADIEVELLWRKPKEHLVYRVYTNEVDGNE